MARRIYICLMLLCCMLGSAAQTLTLDSCRAMALRNNHDIATERVKQDIARNIRKSARTKYLPRVTMLGGYELMSREISLLSGAHQSSLSSIGTTAVTGLSGILTEEITSFVQQGMMSPETAAALQQGLAEHGGEIARQGNEMGNSIVDALHTDTRQVFAASVMVTQPVYMGGAITAANRIASLQEDITSNNYEKQKRETLYSIDHTYWLVVSLTHKMRLAENYNKLVAQLDADVKKMIEEGVATRADGLKVAVKLNESEMKLAEARNGVTLAKMLLCQQCGLPLESDIILADENTENISVVMPEVACFSDDEAITSRPETRLLENTVSITREAARLTRAAFLPQVALTGGYVLTNPNIYDGYKRSFAGMWNVGIVMRLPVWNWMEGSYKVRAAKAVTRIAEYKLVDAKEKMKLQIHQEQFRMREAERKLATAQKNISSAQENLRCANIGFKEGVISSTDVIGAQTAWHQAQSQLIDAKIDLRMSRLALDKALGR